MACPENCEKNLTSRYFNAMEFPCVNAIKNICRVLQYSINTKTIKYM